MKIDQLVSDTLTDHEHLAPETDQILAEVHRRLDRPRAGGWPATIAVAAVLVTGTAVGVVALRGQPHQDSAAPSGSISAASPSMSSPSMSSPSSSSSVSPAPARTIQSLTMPFDLGWLPAGSQQWLAHRINIGVANGASSPSFDGEYLLNVADPGGTILVDVQQMPGDLSGVMFKSGPGRATTVNGRPAIESSNSNGPGGYEVYFTDATGGTIYVNVATAQGHPVPVAKIVADGRRVAAGVRFPGSTQVNPAFGIGYVPAGLKVVAFDVEPAQAGGTSYQVGVATSEDPAVQIGTNLAGTPSGTAGRPVLGHPTRYNTDRGYTELYVLNAVHGSPLAIGSSLPLAELYRIADGLVLPN